jgi:N-acyl-D-amino-acid deacylase
LLGRNKENEIFETYGQYISSIENTKINNLRINYAGLVGNGTIRIAVKGFDPSPMSKNEMSRVKTYVEEALNSGAKGVSMGLMYAPENYYSFDELLDIARILYKYNKVLAVHIRGEGNNLLSSIKEVAELAGKAGISIHISHFKAAGRMNWGEILEIAIETVNKYREKGMDITCDVYPYNAGSTLLYTLLPPSFLAGGIEEMISQEEWEGLIALPL